MLSWNKNLYSYLKHTPSKTSDNGKFTPKWRYPVQKPTKYVSRYIRIYTWIVNGSISDNFKSYFTVITTVHQKWSLLATYLLS